MAAKPLVQKLPEIYTRIYISFLKSFIYDDVAFEDNATELTLGAAVNENRDIATHDGGFREDEILVYGMPVRRQLPSAATKRLREEVDATLQTVAEVFYANSSSQEDVKTCSPISKLPEDLQSEVDGINSMQLEVESLSLRSKKLLSKTRTTREEFEHELEQLICNTFPAFRASRNASIDLLVATLEATLQKLNSIRECARQAVYNHQVEENPNSETVSRAISIAYQALVDEEEALTSEAEDLDRQIREYEDLLRLVDGTSGGYQQIVKDWVKIKRETDECLRDLRRLGWTGD